MRNRNIIAVAVLFVFFIIGNGYAVTMDDNPFNRNIIKSSTIKNNILDERIFKINRALIKNKKLIVTLNPGLWKTEKNVSIPEDVVLNVPQGAVIKLNSGMVVKFKNNLKAGRYKIFEGEGSVEGLSEAYPEWWGASADNREGENGNNDTATFKNAIASLQEGGQLNCIKQGYYDIRDIEINKKIIFNGGNFIVGYYPAQAAIIVKNNGAELRNVYVKVNGATSSNSELAGILVDNAQNVKLINCTVDGSKNTIYFPDSFSSIYIRNSKGIRLYGCKVLNSDKEGLFVQNSNDVEINNCIAEKTGYSGISTRGGSNIRVISSTANDCGVEKEGSDGASGISVNSLNSLIKKCTVTGRSKYSGIQIGHRTKEGRKIKSEADGTICTECIVMTSGINGIASNGSDNITILNNTIKGSEKYGIRFQDHPKSGKIIGNEINKVNNTAISIFNGKGFAGKYNISKNKIFASGSFAIAIIGAKNCEVMDNEIVDCNIKNSAVSTIYVSANKEENSNLDQSGCNVNIKKNIINLNGRIAKHFAVKVDPFIVGNIIISDNLTKGYNADNLISVPSLNSNKILNNKFK